MSHLSATINHDTTADDLFMKSFNQGMEYRYTTGATHSDADLDELKTFLRVTHADDDFLLDDYLDSAIEDMESLTGKTLITREISAYWRKVNDCVELPRSPIVSIGGVNRVDNDGNVEPITNYNTFTSPSFPGRMVLTGLGTGVQISITYQAGFGDTFTDIPTRLQKAAFNQVRFYYDKTPLHDGLQIKQPENVVFQAWRLASQYIDMTEF